MQQRSCELSLQETQPERRARCFLGGQEPDRKLNGQSQKSQKTDVAEGSAETFVGVSSLRKKNEGEGWGGGGGRV